MARIPSLSQVGKSLPRRRSDRPRSKLWALWAIALLCLTGLAACSALSGYPPPPGDQETELKALQPYFAEDVLAKYNFRDDADRDGKSRREYRDDVVNARLRTIDLNFYEFEKRLALGTRTFGLVTDLVTLGLNAAGAVTGGTAIKSALAAASAGIVGASGAVNENLFYEKTLPALIAQMRAQRKQVLARIRVWLRTGTDEYSLHHALIDVEDYYVAGTILGALAAVVEDAGATSAKADVELKRPAMEAIVDRIERLSEEQALKLAGLMEPNLSKRSEKVRAPLELMDPTKARLRSKKAAKQFLKAWAALDDRSSDTIEEWNANLKKAETN